MNEGERSSSFITCNKWRKFWITIMDGEFKLGLGEIYNKRLILSFPYSLSNKLIKSASILNKDINKGYLFKIKDEGNYFKFLII